MTIASTTNRVTYTGNGTTTNFSFPYLFLAGTDLKVYQNGVLKTLTTHYTVSGAGNPAGGTVTFLTAPGSGDSIVILNDPPLTQTLDLEDNDALPAEPVERAFDRLTIIAQRLNDRLGRAAVLPDGYAGAANPALPTPEASTFLGWASDASGLRNYTRTEIATIAAFGDAVVDKFTGDGSTTAFTLSKDPGSQDSLLVSVGGVVQENGVDFTWSPSAPTTLTFASAPLNGEKVQVYYQQALPTEDSVLRADLADTTDPSNGAALVANAVARVDSIASLRALPVPSRKTVVYVEGYYTPNDGGGSAFLWVPSSTNADNGGTVIQPNSLPANGRWERSADEVPVEWFGAVGNGVADDTAAIMACLTFCRVVKGLPGKIYSVSTIDLNDDDRYFSGYGATLRANSAGPIIRSLLANRSIPNKSLENVKIIGWRLDGNSLALNCLQLERFTRQCAVRDCEIRGATGDGIDLYESWSYEFSGNRVTNNGGRGGWFHATSPTDTDGNNAFCFTGNWFSLNGAEGFQVESVQGGFIAGNTSEYNGATNAIIAGRSLDVIGNYFEGFSNARTSLGGSESCVILGTADLPFLRSSFKSYVNGGSVGASSFDGDGIELFNVIESEVTGLFSQSTRYAYVFSEAWTLIGSEIGTSLDANGTLRTPAIRNITTGTTGGLEVVKGTNAFGNSARRNGATAGLRDERQIKANGVTGSIAENRILENGNIAFRYGKLSSALGIFDFDALDGYYYRFNKPSAVAAVVTTAQRDALPNKANGMIIYNSTTGNYEGYKASSGTWATLG